MPSITEHLCQKPSFRQNIHDRGAQHHPVDKRQEIEIGRAATRTTGTSDGCAPRTACIIFGISSEFTSATPPQYSPKASTPKRRGGVGDRRKIKELCQSHGLHYRLEKKMGGESGADQKARTMERGG